MKTLTILLGMILAIGSEVTQAAIHEHDMAQHQVPMQMASSDASHIGFGVVKAANAKAGKVQIAHEAIATLGWPPMTMWFAVRDPLPRDIKIGDTVRFELMQGEKKQWVIDNIRRK